MYAAKYSAETRTALDLGAKSMLLCGVLAVFLADLSNLRREILRSAILDPTPTLTTWSHGTCCQVRSRTGYREDSDANWILTFCRALSNKRTRSSLGTSLPSLFVLHVVHLQHLNSLAIYRDLRSRWWDSFIPSVREMRARILAFMRPPRRQTRWVAQAECL